MKQVFIIHGWGGNPEEGWFPWLEKELEKKGYLVSIPTMPNTNEPVIKKWVSHLSKIVGTVDEETYFVGHSIGCQAIMRYLETLPNNAKVRGVIFVAGWFNLTEDTWDETYTKEIANPWIKEPINFDKIKKLTRKIVEIASDNDPYVPLSDKDIFKKKLGAEIIVLHNSGHISGEDGIKKLPSVLKSILEVK